MTTRRGMKARAVLVLWCLSIRLVFPAADVNSTDSIDVFILQQIDENIPYRQKQLQISEEDVLKMADALPAFGVYKDTYFTTGIPLNQSINGHTADAMFQLSIRQRLTRSRLPFNSFLYFTYTQKTFWDIYADSSPFRDNNYNPGIGIGRYIIHDNRLKGTAFAQIEHESNGESEKESRSWNMLSFTGRYFYNLQLVFEAKVWIPIVDGENNPDLLDYRGLGYFSVDYITKDQKWWLSADLNPRKGFGNVNTTLTAAFKVSRKSSQYVFARLYDGVGDSLLDYKRYEMNIRLGFCIKPDFRSIF